MPPSPRRFLVWTITWRRPASVPVARPRTKSSYRRDALDTDKTKTQSIIDKHQGLRKNLIAILLDVQECYNYLPPDALRQVAKALGMPLIEVIGVATFYRAFSMKPRGKHTCLVCLGTACHVRGGPKILEELERKLDVPAGETTKDGQFSLETVACLGCCAIGPVVVIDGEYHGHATIRKVGPILGKYQKPEAS
ncbi:MAG: NAD(P)H-dependent oxidoreductase subunit E [Candidatus Aminicenantes bacterium]|nr:MAG: NAD(P)H-dependent oxidoreductase subunit E [Candidatus Aminicenantes bacterium]RPJ03481.1 MAG: NAD(P)H-dependent oxidoreductase subunit E [Candidatus Aminicenantes bacterium]